MKRTANGILKSWCLLLCGILLLVPPPASGLNTMGSYQSFPLSVAPPTLPLVMLILDSSGSMGWEAYEESYDPNETYYGFFEPDTNYIQRTINGHTYYEISVAAPVETYGCRFPAVESAKACKVLDGDWNGGNDGCYLPIDNEAQCLAAVEGCFDTRVNKSKNCYSDGGTWIKRDGDNNESCYRLDLNESQCGRLGSEKRRTGRWEELWQNVWEKMPAADGDLMSGNELNHEYMDRIDIAKLVLTGGKTGEVTDESVTPPVTYTYLDGENVDLLWENSSLPTGVIQENDGVVWGLTRFNDYNGGVVLKPIGSSMQDVVDAANNVVPNGHTPLGEAVNTVTRYFQQIEPIYAKKYTCASGGGDYDNPWCNQGSRDQDRTTCRNDSNCQFVEMRSDYEYTINNEWNPYYDNSSGALIACDPKAAVILITDGEPTGDFTLDDTTRDSATDVDIPKGHQFSVDNYILDDIAYWMHHNDMIDTIDGMQNLDFYAISAFGGGASDYENLQQACILGGYKDRDNNNRPNTPDEESGAPAANREWDKDNDGLPDNYATADQGLELGATIRAFIGDIEAGVASGSAASVISASRSGEGAVFQAVYYPQTEADGSDRVINWVGDLHALWLDDYGNMREDCGSFDSSGTCDSMDRTLDFKRDNILVLFTDEVTGKVQVGKYNDADGNGRISDGCSVSGNTTEAACNSAGGDWSVEYTTEYLGVFDMEDVNYLWSASQWLNDIDIETPIQRAYDSNAARRYIFTQIPDASGVPVAVEFSTSAAGTALGGLPTAEYTGYLNVTSADVDALYPTTTEVADAIVDYVRGEDQADFRSRLYDWQRGDGAGAQTHKLGDIINSSPTVVSQPAENYDSIYGDESYRQFRRRYRHRRTMVYAGGNDGGMHAFNGGYYDRDHDRFLLAPPGDTEYELGSEMWMFIPHSLLPHLKWMTDPNYTHVAYVDLKPYVFDAKIFRPDADHPYGWGTVMVGGMRFGGGDFLVDLDGDPATTEEITKSSYFILDITNPEVPPTILGEFSHDELGFTTAAPTAIPMLLCDNSLEGGNCPDNSNQSNLNWPMNWYLAFGSGPFNADAPVPDLQTAIAGRSSQTAKLFVLELGGTEVTPTLTDSSSVTPLNYIVDTGFVFPPVRASGFPLEIPGTCSDIRYTTEKDCTANAAEWDDFQNSFFSDVIAVDYDLDFKTDSLYLGSISNTGSTSPATTDFEGGVHRLVIGEDSNPSNWYVNTFYNAAHPVSGAPSAAWDGNRAWIYFGTGRFYNSAIDKTDSNVQSFYGLKETYDTSGKMNLAGTISGLDGDQIADVTDLWVEDRTGRLMDISPVTHERLSTQAIGVPLSGGGLLVADTFDSLNHKISDANKIDSTDPSPSDLYHGWKLDFPVSGERNIGQGALLGDILTFTTYVPSNGVCSGKGESFLWALYYRTGTAYYKNVIGQEKATSTGTDENLRTRSLGGGMATTPSIHTGAGTGSKAFVQTSTGAIIGIEQANPGATKSGMVSWRTLSD